MATVTITFQSEDDAMKLDLSQYGTVTSRSAPTPSTAFPSGRANAVVPGPNRTGVAARRDTPDPRGRQTVVVLNSGAITLAEIQRVLKAAGVRATAV